MVRVVQVVGAVAVVGGLGLVAYFAMTQRAGAQPPPPATQVPPSKQVDPTGTTENQQPWTGTYRPTPKAVTVNFSKPISDQVDIPPDGSVEIRFDANGTSLGVYAFDKTDTLVGAVPVSLKAWACGFFGAGGGPWAGARIEVVPLFSTTWQSSSGQTGTGDTNGYYVFTGPPGRYAVFWSGSDFPSAWKSADHLAEVSGVLQKKDLGGGVHATVIEVRSGQGNNYDLPCI